MKRILGVIALAGLLGGSAAVLAAPLAAHAAPAVGKTAVAHVASGVMSGGVVEAGAAKVKCGLACTVRRPERRRRGR